jgi:hypothetical protein
MLNENNTELNHEPQPGETSAAEVNDQLPGNDNLQNSETAPEPQQEPAKHEEPTPGELGGLPVQATAKSSKEKKKSACQPGKAPFATIEIDGKTIEIDPARNNVASVFDGPEMLYLFQVYKQRKAAGLSKSFNQFIRQTMYAGCNGFKIGHSVPRVQFKNMENPK